MLARGQSISAVGVIALLTAFSFASISKADSGSGKEAPAKTKSTPAATEANPAKDPGNAAPAASAVELEFQELRSLLLEQSRQLEAQQQALREQQERIAALESELHAARGPQAPAATAVSGPSIATPIAQVNPPVQASSAAPPQGQTDNALKGLEDRIKKVGPFSFAGDIRLRDDAVFAGPANQSQVRHREQVRLRVYATAKLNDDISGGFAWASGDINNPISTNQTLNQFYTRKPFLLDRAYITYTPHQFKPLTLTGGKFAYPWYNTELTWDKDINPEGLAQTLAFNFESTPVLKRFALVGFELPFGEVAGVAVNNKSLVQSVVYGGQVQAVWQLQSWLKLSTYGAFYNYHNPDAIALALATANANSPANGLLKLGGNTVQNSTVTTTATTVVTDEGAPISTGIKTITNAQFLSRFGLLDTIARFDVKTPSAKWPIIALGDYVQNTRACSNTDALQPLPANTTTQTFAQTTNAPCNPHQRRGYWLEGRFGRTEKPKDIQFAYTRVFVEREAVMGAFNFSDMRQPSNVTQHRVEAIYQAFHNIQLEFTGLFGRPLNFGNAAPPENLLKRVQFDAVYKF